MVFTLKYTWWTLIKTASWICIRGSKTKPWQDINMVHWHIHGTCLLKISWLCRAVDFLFPFCLFRHTLYLYSKTNKQTHKTNKQGYWCICMLHPICCIWFEKPAVGHSLHYDCFADYCWCAAAVRPGCCQNLSWTSGTAAAPSSPKMLSTSFCLFLNIHVWSWFSSWFLEHTRSVYLVSTRFFFDILCIHHKHGRRNVIQQSFFLPLQNSHSWHSQTDHNYPRRTKELWFIFFFKKCVSDWGNTTMSVNEN